MRTTNVESRHEGICKINVPQNLSQKIVLVKKITENIYIYQTKQKQSIHKNHTHKHPETK